VKITFVKKIRADGSACPKCADVQKKLEDNDQLKFITATVIADERDPASEGMVIAKKYAVERAPFFIVEKENQAPVIYTVYLKFAREVLDQKSSAKDEARDLLESNPDLDFL
jgi:hypothetical protein